jgi:hypothetical protein
MSSSSAMALEGDVGRRSAGRLQPRARASARRVELYPGILESARIALSNRRARRGLAAASDLAERGRSTGVRV